MTATVIILPTLVDRVLAEPAPSIDTDCVDADPEMTALLAEPVPALTVADICRDERE